MPAHNYAVEATTNLTRWTAIVTNTTNPSGTFDFIDFSSRSMARRFYRVRPVP